MTTSSTSSTTPTGERSDISPTCTRRRGAAPDRSRSACGHSGHNPLERRVLARGSYCVIGDPDAVARELSRLQAAGLDGLALNFVDYLTELPYFAAEVLPRLEKVGLRAAVRAGP